MGVVFQVLTGVVKMDGALIAPSAAILLGLAALLCGLAAAHVLKQFRYWWAVILIAGAMGVLQYILANSSLNSLTTLLSGALGVLVMILISILISRRKVQKPESQANGPMFSAALLAGIGAYGGLALLVAIANIVPPVYEPFRQVVIQGAFPAVTSADGFVTAAGSGPAFRPLTHPGTYALLVAFVGYLLLRRAGMLEHGSWRSIGQGTVRSAGPATVGVLAMVGLSAIMDHTGMSLLLGQALSAAMGGALPVISPVIGMLGAFATGSNQNSNVLFAPLQMSAALALGLAPAVVVAAQTTGGALGAMIAPAKLIIGCSTVGATGQEGVVLRRTLPYGLLLALIVGFVALLMARG
jgi:lactate permease